MSSRIHRLPEIGPAPPLCVDLDGTLLRSDLLVESVFALARRHPLHAVAMLRELSKGRAHFKEAVARDVDLDVSRLPYREELLNYVRRERDRGRYTVLVTASNERYAKAIARHLDCFDDVMASTDTTNLKGAAKADALARRFGERRFAYAGDSTVDEPVWLKSAAGLVVGGNRRAERAAREATTIERVLGGEPNRVTTTLRAMRPHQWLKNLLVFVPLFAGHRADAEGILAAIAAFVAFCLIASAAYLLNDLLDLEADRSHPTKRHRPLAAGALPLKSAIGTIPALVLGGFALAVPLTAPFVLCLAAYFALTVGYSLYLKRYAVIDVMTLAALYTLRVIAGGAAAGVALSFWMLAFSMFLFLSLALVKRTTELRLSRETNHDLSCRGYAADDMELLRSMGIASGYMAVLVVALYINSEDVTRLYADPQMLWLLCPGALYWVSRVWLKTSRGEMHDDPLVFTVKDRASQVLAVVSLLILLGAL